LISAPRGTDYTSYHTWTCIFSPRPSNAEVTPDIFLSEGCFPGDLFAISLHRYGLHWFADSMTGSTKILHPLDSLSSPFDILSMGPKDCHSGPIERGYAELLLS